MTTKKSKLPLLLLFAGAAYFLFKPKPKEPAASTNNDTPKDKPDTWVPGKDGPVYTWDPTDPIIVLKDNPTDEKKTTFYPGNLGGIY